MTRAFQHIMHFDFRVAYDYNKLSVIVFPILFFVYVRELIRLYKLLFKQSE